MNNENFRTAIIEVQETSFAKFINCEGIDIDINQFKASIDWNLEPDARTYGVKSIVISVKKVEFSLEWYIHSEDLTPEEIQKLISAGGRESISGNIEGSLEFDTTKQINGKNWQIEENFYFRPDGGISPEELEIDFEKLLITVS